ncbi:glycoside hydrolase family 32 protein [Vibrio sp. DW001]|uniref:glycoside hydrolase family 32 protein n=1 Tax=Vibrio sp. DW001 TaxID=2912315 RepID=UPI0023AF4705|nr:glycoside hydrolase family 32 protein [Vibrio sp. DW001]WED29740.1 glycoside hydrolase family 32 protein [Vibrio sp. DW001]
MLDAYIENCGGISNVNRILSTQGRLILEIDNDEWLSEGLTGRYCSSMSQVSIDIRDKIEPSEFIRIGTEIRKRQLDAITKLGNPKKCEFRPDWHISPPMGLLNDPNGFIYHGGTYHLFYQWYPFGCVHKDKFWAHLTSTDLINWQQQPVALTPSDWFDSHGVFSGHAISTPQELMIFYTGNVRTGPERERHTTQCLAVSTDGISFEKLGPVITGLPEGVTSHCRDPKVIKIGKEWWMLIGVQREDLVGRLAVYKSYDLHHWDFDKLYGDELGNFGYMWECPDLFELDDQLLAVIGPQGIQSDSHYHTVAHHNGFLKASISEQGELSMSDFTNLDHGFDFYAPQTLETPDGRRVLTAWMGLPDEINQPSVDSGWIHQLSSLRELTLADGNLIQKPIKELEALRSSLLEFELNNASLDLKTKSFELQVELAWGSELSLFKDSLNECLISLDESSKTLFLNRVNTLIREGDTIRERKLNSDTVTLQIMADNSSIEIFINGGESVMSSRIFTPATATELALKGRATFRFWQLSSAKLGIK